ncbi:uncharacterized protein [Venturia canescens]|uniref:uncharacterized protein n=1 Tax=Venturia canescens TaxID=32260 RepID=UPI001C9BE39A|nr:uncharacterized protein LOC122414110 [Venturia canescens]
MEEVNTRSIFGHVSLENKSELCRLLFFGEIELSNDDVLKIYCEYAREHFSDRVTGLMLVYPNYMIHLMESTEEEIFQACLCLTNFKPKLLGISKYFPMEISVGERFFKKWYGRKVVDSLGSENPCKEIDRENFEEVTNAYRNLMKNLYTFYNELRDVKTKSHACLMKRLEDLASVGDTTHLPEEKTIKVLVESSWGESLEQIVDDYWTGISSEEKDDNIWPFPENQCPPIETIIKNI